MKLSELGRKNILWGRFIRLSVLTIPMIWITTIGYRIREKRGFRLGGKRGLSMFITLFCRQFLNKDFLNSECIVVDYEDYRPIGRSLDGVVGFAWVCEKMKINVKIKNPSNMLWRHFENDTLINTTNEAMHKSQAPVRKEFFENNVAFFGIYFISSGYGHKILSKLAINPHLKRCTVSL